MNPQTCIYESSTGSKCNRSIQLPSKHDAPYCSLHCGCNLKSTEEIKENRSFAVDFQAVLEAKDGNWCGFIFPSGIKFPKEIDFKVDASESRLDSLELDNVVFKESVDFSNAIFKNGLIVKGSNFEGNVAFNQCLFDGDVEFISVHFKRAASFYRADFSGRVILRANFNTQAIFNEAIFRDAAVFSGWRNVKATMSGVGCQSLASSMFIGVASGNVKPTLKQRVKKQFVQYWGSICRSAKLLQSISKQTAKNIYNRFLRFRRKFSKVDPNTDIYLMFEGEGQLQNVIFLKPNQILFSEVDLSRVHFRGTNLRGVRFLGVKWWQPIFNRNGLYDEVYVKRSPDGPFRHLSLPVLEETCRNARVALEENRSFNTASDFYIAEMEAVREQQSFCRRHFFSVTALYRSVSRYGTSVGAAFWMLSLIYFLHVTASIYVQLPIGLVPSLEEFLEVALRSLKILLLVRTEQGLTVMEQSWLDIGLRLLGPIQIAMLAIAFRARIKRH